MAKNEEENTGYITQSTRHSMLVSLSREINSKKAALGEGCESESEPEAEDKEEEG